MGNQVPVRTAIKLDHLGSQFIEWQDNAYNTFLYEGTGKYEELLKEKERHCEEVSAVLSCTKHVVCGSYGCVFDTPYAGPEGERLLLKVAYGSEPVTEVDTELFQEVLVSMLLYGGMVRGELPPIFNKTFYSLGCSSGGAPESCQPPFDKMLGTTIKRYVQRETDHALNVKLKHHSWDKLSQQILSARAMGADDEEMSSMISAYLVQEELVYVDKEPWSSVDEKTRKQMASVLKESVQRAFEKTKHHAYFLVENVPNSFKGVVNASADAQIVVVTLAEILGALFAAHNHYELAHNDLHTSNLRMKRVPHFDLVAVRLFSTCVIFKHSGWCPIIIDYGLAQVKHKSGRLHANKSWEATLSVMAQKGPATDMMRLLHYMRTTSSHPQSMKSSLWTLQWMLQKLLGASGNSPFSGTSHPITVNEVTPGQVEETFLTWLDGLGVKNQSFAYSSAETMIKRYVDAGKNVLDLTWRSQSAPIDIDSSEDEDDVID
jgi:hypothetical protein